MTTETTTRSFEILVPGADGEPPRHVDTIKVEVYESLDEGVVAPPELRAVQGPRRSRPRDPFLERREDKLVHYDFFRTGPALPPSTGETCDTELYSYGS